MLMAASSIHCTQDIVTANTSTANTKQYGALVHDLDFDHGLDD